MDRWIIIKVWLFSSSSFFKNISGHILLLNFLGYIDFKKYLQDLEISQYTSSVVPPTKCFVDGSKLCLTNLSEIQKLIMEVNPNLKDDNTNFQWCQPHLIFTNNDLFSALKLPPLSVLSLFSQLGLKSMQPFSISEPRWNKISVILSE